MKALEYLLARFALATVYLLPDLARVYAKGIDVAIPRLRRIALQNLEMAGLDFPDEIADGVFASIARLLVTFSQFPIIKQRTVHKWIRREGFENFMSAKERGKGVLIATAHLGNWELSAFAHAFMFAPMNIVVRPLDNRRIDELVEHRRALSGNKIIRKTEAAREILRALHAGEAVGILIDQNTTLDQGVFIDFFGKKACAGTAFVKLAHHTGAAVVPGFALWHESEKRYVLRFFSEIEMTGDVLADTQRVHSQLESVIREYPDQWLWIHRRWKTRPPGEASLY